MSEAIKRRRGTTAEHASFTGLVGELTVDTSKKVVVVHDGETPGGFPLAREGLPSRYLFGLDVANDTTTPATFLMIAPGSCRSENEEVDLSITQGMRKNCATSWAAGNGNGALDTGSLAPWTWYFVHVIGNQATGDRDILVSTSFSNPVLPSGYTAFRRIFSFVTDGSSHIYGFIQVGDDIQFKSPMPNASGVNNGGAVATLRNVTVPPGIKWEVVLSVVASGPNPGANDVGFLAVDDPDKDVSNFLFNFCLHHKNGAVVAAKVRCFTNTNSQVMSFDNSAAASDAILSLWTCGYVDRRGKR